MIFYLTGLLMGAVGSFHCVGMCGPLAIALPVVQENANSRFFGSLLYNVGRSLTYGLLGLLFGFIGLSTVWLGMSHWISIILGLLILLLVVFPSMSIRLTNHQLFLPLRKILGNLHRKKNYASLLFFGLLNGLLPCGLVLLAISAAIANADPFSSGLFMVCFGLGTLPLMWSLMFFGGSISLHFRNKIRKGYPWFMAMVAVLLILRGLGYDFLSIFGSMKPSPAVDCAP